MYYLGKYGSEASRREYDRVIGEFIANGRQAFYDPDDILIGSLIVSFLDYVEKECNYCPSSLLRINRACSEFVRTRLCYSGSRRNDWLCSRSMGFLWLMYQNNAHVAKIMYNVAKLYIVHNIPLYTVCPFLLSVSGIFVKTCRNYLPEFSFFLGKRVFLFFWHDCCWKHNNMTFFYFL